MIQENIVAMKIVISHITKKYENDLFTRSNKIIRQEIRTTEKYIHIAYVYIISLYILI